MSLTFFPFSNSFYSIYIVKENPSGIATLVKSDLQIGSSRREWSYHWLQYVNVSVLQLSKVNIDSDMNISMFTLDYSWLKGCAVCALDAFFDECVVSVYGFHLRRGLNDVSYGKAPPREPTPYPYLTEKTPISYTFY